MKRRLSVRELKEYCTEHRFHTVSYWAENQESYCVANTCKIRVSFPRMMISETPDSICLKSGENTIGFERVKYVDIDTDRTVLGTVFTVFCDGSFGKNSAENIYTLIAE